MRRRNPRPWHRRFASNFPALGGGGSALELDSLDNLYAVHSTKRVLTSYLASSALVRIRRSSDNAEQDFGPDSEGWVDSAAVATFIGGGSGFVTTLYDQSGNSRPATQTTSGNQPTISLAGAHPTVNFVAGSSQFLSVPAALGFARNVSAASLICVRAHSATNISTQHVYLSANLSGNTRLGLQQVINTVHAANGRRLDADSSVASTGFASNTNWAVQIGRWDWANALLHHRRDSDTETVNPFQTAGVTSDTDSTHAQIGRNGAATNYFSGQIALVAFVRDLITDVEDAALPTTLAGLKL